MTDDSKVRASGVGCVYRRRNRKIVAVDGFDLDIQRNEFVALVGPSGCGKSTMLRLIAGLRRPTVGEVQLVHDDPDRPLTATVFQEYSIFPWRTVESNIRLGLDAAGVPREEGNRRVADWIERVGLHGFGQVHPGSLSGGMKQRVALARALVMEPEVLLMDEPFAALDAQRRKLLQDEVLSICETGNYTVLLVTHSLHEALLLADRIVLMTAQPGRVKSEYRVPFPRPRDASVRGSAEFAEMTEMIWQDLRSEVEAASRQGGPAMVGA